MNTIRPHSKPSKRDRFFDAMETIGAAIVAIAIGAFTVVATIVGGIIAVAATVAVIAILIALGGAFTAVIIYFVWNICQLHTLFGADEITWTLAFGIGIALSVLKALLSR